MTESLTARVLKGSLISFLIKFIQKSLGLISTLVLARLLTPEDFGIVAIAALVLHFCDVLSTAGSESYLIQKDNLDKTDIDSSWTLELILKTVLFVLFFISVPFIASFYGKSELESVLYVSATVLLINALKSPGIALLKKELNYRKIFILNVSQKLIVFTFIIIWVVIEPSFWALILGDVVSAFVLAVGSYFIHPYRPRLCTKKVRQQLKFSQWIILKSGVGYSKAQMDVFFVAKYFSAELVGMYHLARQLALMPSTDIVAPAIEPLLSAFSKVKNEKERFNNQFKLCFLVVNLAIIPCAIFILFFPNLIIDVLLGSQWQEAQGVLGALSLLLVAIMLNQLIAPFAVALGKVKSLFYYDLLSFVFIFIGLFSFSNLNLFSFSILRGALAWLPLIFMLVYICKVAQIKIWTLIINMLTLLVLAYLAGLVSSYVIAGLELNVFLMLVIVSIVYFFILLVFLGLISKTLFKTNLEWQRVSELTINLLKKMSNKLRISFSN